MGLIHYADRPHELREIVQAAINRNGYFAFSRVNAEVLDNNIILTGSVETYYQKQLAQETVRKVADSVNIENQIQVGSGIPSELV